MRTSRHLHLSLVAAMAAIALLGSIACQPLPAPPPGGGSTSCDDIAWGSQQRVAERMITSKIVDVRAGRHRCFDRLVIDLDGHVAPGWVARYGPVEEPGSGFAVPLRGGASLEVIARAPAYDGGSATYDPPVPHEAVDVAGFETFRQVAYAGSFEGQSTFGIGVRARLPFRIFGVEGPDGGRHVVDVAHAWA